MICVHGSMKTEKTIQHRVEPVFFGAIVVKLRKIVKVFRVSPRMMTIFNLKISFEKVKTLFLVCKTRWNSLIKLLRRFYEVRKEVKLAMIHLEREFDVSDKELKKIKELCDALAPIEMIVKDLCKESAYLLLAEKVTEFAAKKLRGQETSISPNSREKKPRSCTPYTLINIFGLFGWAKGSVSTNN